MIRRFVAAVVPVLLAGCMLSPTDDQLVASTSAPLTFTGFHLNPGAPVQVQAWNYATHGMQNVGVPVFSETTSSVMLERPLFAWTATRTLAPSFWRSGPAGGRCAVVGGWTTVGGSRFELETVEPDWSTCFNSNRTTGSFAANCASDDSPRARLFTADWGNIVVGASTLNLVAAVAGSRLGITLDNYTPTPYAFCNAGNPSGCPTGGASDPETWKFFAPNASSITQTAADGTTSTMSFSIDPARSGPSTVYLDNMTSTTLGLRVEGDQLVMTINFEAAGPEIRLNCIRDVGCLILDGRTVDFTTPRAELRFRLSTAGGRVQYSSVDVTFIGGPEGGDVATAAASVGTAMAEKLNTDGSIRAAVNNALDGMVRAAAGLTTFPIDRVSVGAGVLTVRPGCVRD
jgi:hypothetical protein